MSRLKVLLSSLPNLIVPVPNPPDEFSQFSKLPRELRHRIWRFASHEPRSVKLFVYNHHASIPGLTSSIPGQMRSPAILQVSKEARVEGLRYYTPVLERPYLKVDPSPLAQQDYRDYAAFLAGVRSPRLLEEKCNTVYINFHADLFELQPIENAFAIRSIGSYNFDLAALQNIKYLQVYHDFSSLAWGFETITTVLKFAQVNEVTFLIQNWAPEYLVGLEERFEVHGWIRGHFKPEVLRRLDQAKNNNNFDLAPCKIKLKWASNELVDLSAWTSEVHTLSYLDCVLKRTW